MTGAAQFFRSAVIWLIVVSISACGSFPERVPFTASQQATASIPDMPGVRFWVDAPPDEMDAFRTRYRETRTAAVRAGQPFTLLALSGGSDNGAYGAGLLAGWTQSGNRPHFTIVSGVSTGALIAPFAFLGSRYDTQLRQFYTGVKRSDIFSYNIFKGVVSGASIADTKPLARLIARFVDMPLLEAIAAEQAKGRRLFIMTTNLDAQRGVVWDMGAIAASTSPRRLALFRDVILASASIPGVFPPVLVDASSNGQPIRELHVDGSATSNFFTVPASAVWSDADPKANAGGQIYIIKNGTLLPRFAVVRPRAHIILNRALTTVLESYDRSAVISTYRYARSNGMGFKLSFIENDFADDDHDLFSPGYMSRLYHYGEARGRTATHWHDRPPSVDADN